MFIGLFVFTHLDPHLKKAEVTNGENITESSEMLQM